MLVINHNFSLIDTDSKMTKPARNFFVVCCSHFFFQHFFLYFLISEKVFNILKFQRFFFVFEFTKIFLYFYNSKIDFKRI